MPALPVPLPFDPAGGDLPVASTDDLLKAHPRFAQSTIAPVRDALIEAQTKIQLVWQDKAAYAAAQADPLRATGIYLDGHLEDRSLARQTTETNEAARTRMLATPAVVTPPSITSTADAVLAPYTTKKSQVFDTILDRLFLEDGTAAWHSFIGPVDPGYGDRYYTDRGHVSPGGAWTFPDSQNGRMFVLRVPVLSDVTQAHGYAYDGTIPEVGGGTPFSGSPIFVADGSNTGGSEANGTCATFLSTGLATVLDIYQAVVDAVEQVRGGGVRWQLWADPNL